MTRASIMRSMPQSHNDAIADGAAFVLIQMTALILTAAAAGAVFSLGWCAAVVLQPLLGL